MLVLMGLCSASDANMAVKAESESPLWFPHQHQDGGQRALGGAHGLQLFPRPNQEHDAEVRQKGLCGNPVKSRIMPNSAAFW